MNSGRPTPLKIIVMPRIGASAHTITISRKSFAAAAVCVLLLLGLNTAALVRLPRQRVSESDLRALETRTRELSDRMASLAEAERRLDASIRTYFAEKYIDEPGGDKTGSLNIPGSIDGAGYSVDWLDDSLEARAAHFETTEKLVDQAFQQIESVPELTPVRKSQIFSGYGSRKNPVTGKKDFHYGVDFAGSIGMPVYAAGAGTVKSVQFDSGYGLTVIIDHGNGFITQYAHLHSADVKQGQSVRKGVRIASMGDSGMADRPHLCFEVILKGRHIDPEKLLALSPKDIARSVGMRNDAATNSF